MIRFEVLGTPAPQGSKRHVGNGIMVESSAANRPWRAAVAAAAREVAGGHPLTRGPLALEVEFRFRMPQSRRKADRDRGRCPKVSAPDLDKLVRSCCDGLAEGGLILNDALIVDVHATKVEVVGWTGAVVELWPLLEAS